MFIEPFKVEIWMNEWETRCTHNLAEPCVASLTIDGSERLRTAISTLYDGQDVGNIVVRMARLRPTR